MTRYVLFVEGNPVAISRDRQSIVDLAAEWSRVPMRVTVECIEVGEGNECKRTQLLPGEPNAIDVNLL